MSFLGKLFGTDKAVEQTIKTAGSLLDKAFYTDQEEAHDKAEVRREVQDFVLDWMRTTQGQNLSRRLIALSVTGSWLGMHMLSSLMALGSIWAGEKAAKLTASSTLIDGRLDGMTGAVMLILGFYFALPHLGRIIEPAMARFAGKKDG